MIEPVIKRWRNQRYIANTLENVMLPEDDLTDDALKLWAKDTGTQLLDYCIPRFLSPSSLMQWGKDQGEWYIKYAAMNRLPKIPQNIYMALGSAFDAKIKAHLEARYNGGDEAALLQEYFKKQVEIEGDARTQVIAEGSYLMRKYTEYGALADLAAELIQCVGKPVFEDTVEAVVGGVPLLGKPDLYYKTAQDHVILDFKVSGFYSAKAPSPKKGYIKSRPDNKQHKDVYTQLHNGITVDITYKMEDINTDWATQLATYAWCLGAPVGSEIIGAIELLVGKDRIVSYRNLIGREFQETLLARYQDLWYRLKSGDAKNLFNNPDDYIKAKTIADDPDFASMVR